MDYTLAEYIPETFDLLAFNGAIDKLLAMGYPAQIADFVWRPGQHQRGLVVDKRRGNLLKLDRHKYVKVAVHGLEEIPSKQRKALYLRAFDEDDGAPGDKQFIGENYANVDTEFLLVDLSLYSQLVALKDELFPGSGEGAGASDSWDGLGDEPLSTRSYMQVYQDVRRAVDLCHQDGVIKDPVALDPAKYIRPSPALGRTLQQQRRGGKQVFLLTNSYYDYTRVVMTFLLGEDWVRDRGLHSISASLT